ncbi:MAG: hypothetical protein Crog4KO_29700 [Crocinitomicaceae bacterium]
MLFYGTSIAQEQEENTSNYLYEFAILNIDAQADEATIKDIRTYSKDLFEVHPTFSQGTFKIVTDIVVPEDRIRQYLELYGFPVTALVVKKGGQVLTTKAEEK